MPHPLIPFNNLFTYPRKGQISLHIQIVILIILHNQTTLFYNKKIYRSSNNNQTRLNPQTSIDLSIYYSHFLPQAAHLSVITHNRQCNSHFLLSFFHFHTTLTVVRKRQSMMLSIPVLTLTNLRAPIIALAGYLTLLTTFCVPTTPTVNPNPNSYFWLSFTWNSSSSTPVPHIRNDATLSLRYTYTTTAHASRTFTALHSQNNNSYSNQASSIALCPSLTPINLPTPITVVCLVNRSHNVLRTHNIPPFNLPNSRFCPLFNGSSFSSTYSPYQVELIATPGAISGVLRRIISFKFNVFGNFSS